MKKKSFLVISYIFSIIALVFLNVSLVYAREINIDEVLNSKSYSNLSPIVKEFIRDYYKENKVILLTKNLAKTNEAYLNPSYIEYLESDDKDKYYVIPSVTAYTPKYDAKNNSLTDYNKGIITSDKSRSIVESNPILPSKFDLRNVNGKNYVTPNKDQGNEGLCWAYATTSLLETHDLIVKNKSYDNSAVLFSEKQMDYALSNDGIVGGNKVVRTARELASGATLDEPDKLLVERLSGFQNTWDTNNNSVITNNGELEPHIVFDREKSLYEVDETLLLSNVNSDLSDPEINEATVNTLKNIVYNYGGVTVNIKSSRGNIIRNFINGDYIAITSVNYFNQNASQHALHLIGWDDDYEYGFCSGDSGGQYGKFVTDNAYYHSDHECGTWGNTSESHEYVKVTGQGAWILKNSWGDDYSYVYLPYDSFINDVFSITKYSEKNWDHSISLYGEYKYIDNSSKYNYSTGNDLIDGDTIVKIKIKVNSPKTISLYYSEDGNVNNLNLVGNYTFDYAGIKTIDLRDKNLHINSNSYFQLDNYYEISLFTDRNNDSIMAYTDDYVYSIENEKPSNYKYLSVPVTTELRNVEDNELINYKIKKANGTYFPTSAYSIINNKSYYDMASPIIKINEQYAKKGTYTLETWKDNILLYSSSLNLNADYMSIGGSGTKNDPWQIKNVRQFNMMRNAPKDNYLLMNDLDFEYDTQNPNGLFYNSGAGWKAMEFRGNFDGDNKVVRNIKASGGLFHSFDAFDTCSYDKCGIHDLNVDNISIYKCDQSTGGIINYIDVIDSYSFDFSNLSLTNSHFYADKDNYNLSNNSYLYVGGIAGKISVYGGSSLFKMTVMKNDNWYSDYEYNVATNIKYITRGYIGGLVGYINTYRMPYLSFNNAKSNMNINLNYGSAINFYVSDMIGAIDELNAHINVNNTIGRANVNSASGIRVSKNAFIGQLIKDNISGDFSINGSKSNLDYTPNDLVNITNYEAGLKPYQLARANYDNIEYYETEYYVNNQYYDGYEKVKFSDRFDTFGDKIPVLKAHPENYSTYYKNILIEVDETKSINDLILNDTNYRKLKVYGSFDCNLDICNNITDETIITIPTEENGYTFKGLKNGSTTLIIYDEISGYLDTVLINVFDEVEHTVTFDSDGGSSVPSQTVNYNAKATKPSNPTKEGYTFKEWQLNGNTYDFNAGVISNITLKAVWDINKYTITFNSDGGSSVTSQTINYNGKVTKPSNPTKEGYTFKEWQLNGNTYDFNAVVISNITLKAVWDKNETIIEDTLKDILENNGYSVNGGLTSKFTLGDSIATIKNKLGNDVSIQTNNTIISTGAVIKKGNESYTVVIKGDLNGDGKINSADLLQMRRYLLEEVSLIGAYKEAGIIESNEEIKSLDLLRLRQYLLEEYEFR